MHIAEHTQVTKSSRKHTDEAKTNLECGRVVLYERRLDVAHALLEVSDAAV